MPSLQEQYDDAMFAFSTGDYDSAIAKLKSILVQEPNHFDAQLALGMAHYRKGEYATAIADSPGATGHRRGATPTTSDTGPTGGRPRSRTWCCYAGDTIG